jgi:hypothetical protein
MDPFTAAMFAWQSGFVFAVRSVQLVTQPLTAQAELTRYALEKHRAFADGAIAASRAVMSGADGGAVVAAALRPAHRRVRANLRSLTLG